MKIYNFLGNEYKNKNICKNFLSLYVAFRCADRRNEALQRGMEPSKPAIT